MSYGMESVSLRCAEDGLLRHVLKSRSRLMNWWRRWQYDLLECCWEEKLGMMEIRIIYGGIG